MVRKDADPGDPREKFLTTEEAAEFLRIKRGTLLNWISLKKFTEADGLRRFGGATRIHFPTLRARALEDTLLTPPPPRRPFNSPGAGRI